jgi:hypothetical protein
LALLLDGIELSSVRRRSWWRASEVRFIEEKSASSS